MEGGAGNDVVWGMAGDDVLDRGVGTAKELIETCCKTILTKRGVTFTKSEDIGELTKKVTKELQLVPEGISDEAKGAENIKLVLRNLMQLTSDIAQRAVWDWSWSGRKPPRASAAARALGSCFSGRIYRAGARAGQVGRRATQRLLSTQSRR